MAGELIGGRYRLERELGRGGFGAVYVALQQDMGRRVAVKLLHRRHLEGVGFERFQREAKLAQHLSHPNTVRLFEFGLHDGTPFIVFELLNGESLASLLHRAGPLPTERVVRITSQILKALMEAHDVGIVHRDIKPANVFLCDYAGEQDFVKVLDFGIAKSVADESAPLTNTGEAVGTPAYMPPEQLSGGALAPATDLYAVGLMMAEMVSGKRVTSGSAMEIAMRQLDQRPLGFPDAVCASPLWPVIERATQKLASQRFASAAEMLAALSHFGSTAIPARPPASYAVQTLAASATVPASTHALPGVPGAVGYEPSVVPGPRPKRSFLGVGLALFLLGGIGVLAVAGVAAAYFVDWGSLFGGTARATTPEAGLAAANSAEAGTAALADTDAGARGQTPTAGGRGGTPVTATSSTPASTPSTATTGKKGSTLLGTPCTSSAECTGALQVCGPSATCECKKSSSFDAPRACGSVCVANNDSENCGACGKRCANDEVCTTNNGGSASHPICFPCAQSGMGTLRILCGPHQCVSPNTDPRNCGGCNKKCTPGQGCEGGVCK